MPIHRQETLRLRQRLHPPLPRHRPLLLRLLLPLRLRPKISLMASRMNSSR